MNAYNIIGIIMLFMFIFSFAVAGGEKFKEAIIAIAIIALIVTWLAVAIYLIKMGVK